MKNRSRCARGIVCLAVLVALPSCGGGGSSPAAPPPVTQPPGPAQANITIRQSGIALLGFSPLPNKFFRVRLPLEMTESAGLGANINYMRMSLFDAGRPPETDDVGAADLNNPRLEARQTRDGTVDFDFNRRNFDSFSIDVSFTDDRGNTIVRSITRLNIVVYPFIITAGPDWTRGPRG